jgi:hypothetical protein
MSSTSPTVLRGSLAALLALLAFVAACLLASPAHALPDCDQIPLPPACGGEPNPHPPPPPPSPCPDDAANAKVTVTVKPLVGFRNYNAGNGHQMFGLASREVVTYDIQQITNNTGATITFDTARLRVRSLSCAPTDYFGNSSLAFGGLALNLDGYLINPSYTQSVPPGTSWFGYIPQHRVLIGTDKGRWPAMSYDANGISYKVRFTMLGAPARYTTATPQILAQHG